MHLVSFPTPPPQKKEICKTIVSSFFWVLQVAPREIEDNGYAFFLGGGGWGGGVGGKQGAVWSIM